MVLQTREKIHTQRSTHPITTATFWGQCKPWAPNFVVSFSTHVDPSLQSLFSDFPNKKNFQCPGWPGMVSPHLCDSSSSNSLLSMSWTFHALTYHRTFAWAVLLSITLILQSSADTSSREPSVTSLTRSNFMWHLPPLQIPLDVHCGYLVECLCSPLDCENRGWLCFSL